MKAGPSLAAVATVLALAGGSGCAQATDSQAAVPSRVSDEVRVGLTEWSVETGPVTATAGDVRFVVTNTGATEHDLVVSGRQGQWRTPMLAPGERYEMSVRTLPGEHLHLECTVTGHHAQGMHTEISVEALRR